jgi:hypothetical protein
LLSTQLADLHCPTPSVAALRSRCVDSLITRAWTRRSRCPGLTDHDARNARLVPASWRRLRERYA